MVHTEISRASAFLASSLIPAEIDASGLRKS
jgi:hypothetical protein